MDSWTFQVAFKLQWTKKWKEVVQVARPGAATCQPPWLAYIAILVATVCRPKTSHAPWRRCQWIDREGWLIAMVSGMKLFDLGNFCIIYILLGNLMSAQSLESKICLCMPPDSESRRHHPSARRMERSWQDRACTWFDSSWQWGDGLKVA